MALAVVYSNFGGMMVFEDRGGSQTSYVPDTLGSMASTVDSTLSVSSRTEYWPYGEEVNGTGTNPSPWSFVGLLGYFTDLLSKLLYVRARYLELETGQWLTRASNWPSESGHEYAASQPTRYTDRTGHSIDPGCPKAVQDGWTSVQSFLKSKCSNPGIHDMIQACWAHCGDISPATEGDCFCKHGSGTWPVDVDCHSSSAFCTYQCGCACTNRGGPWDHCTIRVCPSVCAVSGISDYFSVFIHELMHCCGATHVKKNRDCQADPDCLEPCLRQVLGLPSIAAWGTRLEQLSGGI